MKCSAVKRSRASLQNVQAAKWQASFPGSCGGGGEKSLVHTVCACTNFAVILTVK